MIRVIINGAKGKMGRTAVAAIANEKDLALVAATSRDDSLSHLIQDKKADVVIDFTTPDAVFQNAKIILESGARPVIGTTGLRAEEINQLIQWCDTHKRGGIIAPNFSIGGILMIKFALEAARYFNDVEIIEYHHPHKKDAPSGTAIKTAEMIATVKQKQNESEAVETNSKNSARGIMHHHIPIHAVRLPGVFASQQVIFGGMGETLSIQHDATDRQAMMPGVFLCCRKVMGINKMIYGMEGLI